MTSKSKVKAPTAIKMEVAGAHDLIVFDKDGQEIHIPAQQQAPSAALRMLAVIDKASTDPRTNVDKMRAMLDMQMELIREERRVAYNNSMRDAQAEMEPVVRKTLNDNTKKKYAKLEHVDNAVRPIYTKFGFSLSFNSRRETDGTITMLCDVLHSSGHHEVKELNGAKDIAGAKGNSNKTDIQGAGSTVSYLRRYLTCMVFNITLIDEDDDGAGGKLQKGNDPFANKLAAEHELPFEEQLKVEAGKVKTALLKKDDLEARGSLLMKNLPLMKQLDEAGMQSITADLRAVAEGVSNG